ncbi:MAG: anti-sigma factor [Sphingobacteriales bacterium]|nr:MAG: anti-sigma factor [Sphingobacteriales bacterium]
MERQDIISSGILEMHALGLTSDQEATQVAAWAGQFPEVKAELEAIEKSLELYAADHAIEPSSVIKKEIIAVIDKKLNTGSQGIVKTISPVWKYAAAASVLLLLGSLYFNMTYYSQLKQADIALKNSQQELIAASDKLQAMNNDMDVVKNKYSQAVSLNGLDAAPEAAAKIFWMKNTGDVYIDPSNLPDAPEGKQYQLWAFVDGKPVDGGMIITTKKGNEYHIQKMKSFGKAEAFAVTLETTGGNPTPKGEIYVMGKL